MTTTTTPTAPREPAGSAAIVTELSAAITNGRYAYRERLPPERQLAQNFGVARGTVREALRRLETMNLVSRRIGSGTFVTYRKQLDHDAIANLTSPLELIDVRFGIEPQLVRLAVMNASGRDIDRLRAAADGVVNAGDDAEAFTQADGEFHIALAECTRNPLMSWLYQHINEVRTHRQWSGMKDKVLTPARIAEYNQQHLALCDAIGARDMDAALAVIEAHLQEARRDLIGVGAPSERSVSR